MLFWHTGEIRAQPLVETEVTADGLYRVDPSIMGWAWVRPDADLSRYTRMYFSPTVVQFRDVPEQAYSPRKADSRREFPVTDARRARVRELFGESFHESVSRFRSYELSDELGRDVLMVQGFLTDVISGVPPKLVGNHVTSVGWAWQANIVVELRDSMSGEVLARTLDQQRIDGPFRADTVWGSTPQIVDGWSRLLVRRLGELSDLYPSRLRRLQELSEQ